MTIILMKVRMLENKIKFCVVCGRRIPELSRRKVTCGPLCRKRKKCGYAPYAESTEPPYKDLTSIQKEAQALGLSYGQYMAQRDNKGSNFK